MISIIIPVFNSEETLEQLLNQIFVSLKDSPFELILVDDGSTDGSASKIIELVKRHPHTIGIFLKRNCGQQNALLAGIRQAQGDTLVTIDDDLQYSPSDILKLTLMLEKGYDVVYGVPESIKQTHIRRGGTLLKEWLFFSLLNKPFRIKLTSFRAMNRKTAEYTAQDKNKSVYLSARILQYTKNICNIPVRHYSRYKGKSNYNFVKLFLLLAKTLFYYSVWGKLLIKGGRDPQYEIVKIMRHGE